MNTGEIIKYFRLARNMTQEQLAQDAEISFSTLRKYEANERNPKYEQLSKIADIHASERQFQGYPAGADGGRTGCNSWLREKP